MIADHDLVFGRCHNKEPHSSGILLCRVVVVGYEKRIYLQSLTREEKRRHGARNDIGVYGQIRLKIVGRVTNSGLAGKISELKINACTKHASAEGFTTN